MHEDLKKLRHEWSAAIADLRRQREDIDEQIRSYERQIEALDVVTDASVGGDDARTEDTRTNYIGPEILDWARQYLERHGATTVKKLYEQMPQDMRRTFEAGPSSQPALFRFRRLFRRSSHLFSVRRSDGLVELLEPVKGVGHRSLIMSILKFGDAPRSFVVSRDGISTRMTFADVRAAIESGEQFFVPGPDGNFSAVEIRGGLFRSVGANGVLNNDMAALPVVEFPSEVNL